jgi:hypothetical protein
MSTPVAWSGSLMNREYRVEQNGDEWVVSQWSFNFLSGGWKWREHGYRPVDRPLIEYTETQFEDIVRDVMGWTA